MVTEKIVEHFIELRQFTDKYGPQIEIALREYLPISPPKCENEFDQAVESALFSGGRRLRPIMTLLGAELFGGKAEDVIPAAVAVEFIQASSGIFRGQQIFADSQSKPADISAVESQNEKVAYLVALACLNAAYPLVFVNHVGMPERAMQAHREIVECVGASGLVGDLANSAAFSDREYSDVLGHTSLNRDLGSSALIRLALRLGAILAGADYLDLANLSRVAEIIGEAHQSTNLSVGTESKDQFSVADITAEGKLNSLIDEAKRLLIENFPSNKARSSLIQLVESMTKG